jgi:hypothetical protein
MVYRLVAAGQAQLHSTYGRDVEEPVCIGDEG